MFTYVCMTDVPVCPYVGKFLFTYVCTYICMFMYVHIYIYIYVYAFMTYMHICIYVYICMSDVPVCPYVGKLLFCTWDKFAREWSENLNSNLAVGI